MTPRWWDDLADHELLDRLAQHGVHLVAAVNLVANRDDPNARRLIDAAVGEPR